jgi:hypothetical protein
MRVEGPSPLDSIDTETVVNAVRVALEAGLVDDLDWIEPRQSAVALYELTSALPAGRERRDLGRRVFTQVYEGTASTFNAVAVRIALSAARSLDTPALRARVGLLLDLPTGTTVNPDALALALVVRRENFDRWVARPSVGALSARRLAAKILEHATREAALREQQGDSYPRRLLLMSSDVQGIFRRLLADREPLVWRHAAVARGMLAAVDANLREEVESALDPSLSPTEWRRAAVSLVALLPSDPQTVLKQCRRLVLGDIGQADPGIGAAMVAGLPRVIEAEPEGAESLLEILADSRRLDVAEAIGSLFAGMTSRSFGERIAQTLHYALESSKFTEAGAATALKQRILGALDRNRSENSLTENLRQALVAYETQGARAAHQAAIGAIEAVHQSAEHLEKLAASDESTQAESLSLLVDLDTSCLERSTLVDLLLLNRRPGDSDASVPQIERLYFRLGNWLLDAEEQAGNVGFNPTSPIVQQRRLRTLLHLIDAETIQSDAEDVGQRVRARVRRALKLLLRHLVEGSDASIHRVLCATLARSFDAAIRENVCDPSDLWLIVAATVSEKQSIDAIAEASTNQDVAGPLSAYASFLDADGLAARESAFDPASFPLGDSVPGDEILVAHRVVRLSQGLGAGGAYRAEALRQVVLRLGRGLEALAAARGLSELVDRQRSGFDAVREVERAAAALRELVQAALRRLLQREPTRVETGNVVPLSVLIERTLADGIPSNASLIAQAVVELTGQLPEPIGQAIGRVVSRIDALPASVSSDVYAIPLDKRRSPLPDWLLPRRTIGSFYVVRALGSGGVSSVFVARRSEERNSPRATLFALKVPQYDPTTARSLSEQEFLQLFREEASALLAIPHHTNLARFVTFDLAARPKPILVMELISGLALDRLIRSRSLSVGRAFSYLSGILAGLEAMHAFGLGHLDIKPSNVILRDGETPVLVDFGLSGRKIRPGCGTLDYCSPEVLGVVDNPAAASPMAADIYAFGSMAFEVLTAQPLFDGTDEMSLVTAHVSHDGWPDKLARLGSNPRNAELSIVLAACLRHDPAARPSARETRVAIDALASRMLNETWPLPFTRQSQQPLTA